MNLMNTASEMKIRAKAPLRLGIAGGGTDVSPFCDEHGGAVLNATINLYAHTYLERVHDNFVEFISHDLTLSERLPAGMQEIPIDGKLKLHRAVYRRVMDQFNNGEDLPLRIATYCDAPMGSGLGSSSALVVSMLEAYRALLALPLGEYDLASLAYEIERVDCGFSGGKQDQYAASFGGFNFIEFYGANNVIVNPLRIRRHTVKEFEASTVLFFNGASRESAKIIDDQINSVKNGGKSLRAMHEIRQSAYDMKASILKGSIIELANGLREAWKAKKATSSVISNPHIDYIENIVTASGATSLKVSGAGGGGFMMILMPPELRYQVVKALSKENGEIVQFEFTTEGAHSWTV